MVAAQSATRPGSRTSGPAAPAQHAPEADHAPGTPDVSLADLRPGTSGRLVGIDESVEPATARRLIDLGFAPGAEVAVLRKAPLGDPVVYQVMDDEVALRRTQAAALRVRPAA